LLTLALLYVKEPKPRASVQTASCAEYVVYGYWMLMSPCVKWLHQSDQQCAIPSKLSTDVTIIEIEIAILTENRIELKSNFSCIPSNDFSIEALDRL